MAEIPTLLMTRPTAQAARFVAECSAELGQDVSAVFSPIMAIVAREPAPDLTPYTGVILTSANGAEAAPSLSDQRVYCVGERTADAARMRGAQIKLVARNADALVQALPVHFGAGRLIHLRGAHARGEIAKRLNSVGIETEEAIVYDQTKQGLSDEARKLIMGDSPVVLPLFSPRSAKLVGEAVDRLGANLQVIAMSDAVASAWRSATGGRAQICAQPTAAQMLRRTAAALRR